jgi:hypothetical protein
MKKYIKKKENRKTKTKGKKGTYLGCWTVA